MPAKLSTAAARKRFEDYGFIVPANFTYRNNKEVHRVYDTVNREYVNMSLNNLRAQERRGIRQVQDFAQEQQQIQNLYNLPMSDHEVHHETSYERWLRKQDPDIQAMNIEDQHRVYSTMQDIVKRMSKKKTFSINLDYNNLNLRALTLAAKIVGPRLGNIDVRLTFAGDNNLVDYRHLTPNTVNYLTQLFTTENLDNIKDSSDNPLTSYLNYHTVTLEFVPRKKGRRIAAGFYPYWNVSDIDLSKFGIYSKNSTNISEPCLLTAIKNSEFCTEDQAKMLESFIKTRMVPQTYLADIAELLKVHINLKIMYDNEKSSHRDYGEEYKVRGSIKLYILHGHYFLNSDVNVTELYIKKYNDIHNIHKFVEHPRRFMLKKFSQDRHEFSKTGINIMKVLKLMTEANLLIPMSEKDISKLSWAYEPCRTINFEGYSRPIVIPDVKKCNKYYKHGKKFFGFEPIDEEPLLDELQNVVDSLPLRNHINVRNYYKFSSLMQKIMYEYGCYDGVCEYCGKLAENVREKCIFPRPHTTNDKYPLHLTGKLYYIDLNSAYMSVITGIPDANGGQNTKIAELIRELYEIRKNGNISPELRTTLKYLMNSCWGYSIRRPKLIKHKTTNNLEYNLEEYAGFIIKHGQNYIDIINSFVPHFTCPQFAKSVLDNYNSLMEDIRSKVHVLYENIDAILISEEDYKKLESLGYIGTELGKFKIEHIFSEIDIRSPKRYIAKDYITGETILH